MYHVVTKRNVPCGHIAHVNLQRFSGKTKPYFCFLARLSAVEAFNFMKPLYIGTGINQALRKKGTK
jgi:hypothetical protein